MSGFSACILFRYIRENIQVVKNGRWILTHIGKSDRFKPSSRFNDKFIRSSVDFTELTWQVNNLEYGSVQCINRFQQIDFKYSNCIYVHQDIWTSSFFNIIELISFYMYVYQDTLNELNWMSAFCYPSVWTRRFQGVNVFGNVSSKQYGN